MLAGVVLGLGLFLLLLVLAFAALRHGAAIEAKGAVERVLSFSFKISPPPPAETKSTGSEPGGGGTRGSPTEVAPETRRGTPPEASASTRGSSRGTAGAVVERVLEDWHTRAWVAQIAHYRVANRLRRLNLVPATVSVLLAAGLTVVVLAFPLPDTWLVRVSMGLTTSAIGISTAMVVLFSFGQRADQHVVAADWYASIRRRIEQQLATPREYRGDPREFLDLVKKEMNSAGSQFPEIGERIWRAVTADVGVPDRAIGAMDEFLGTS